MKYSGLCAVHKVSMALLIIGGLNWGLVGLFNLDLVDLLLGSIPLLATVVYVLVGLSAVAVLVTGAACKKCHHDCEGDHGGSREVGEAASETPVE